MSNDNINMENLYEQLLPKVKYGLNKNKSKYSSTVKHIIAKLHVYDRYTQMRIEEIRTLATFSDQDLFTWSTWDWKWGTKLFIQDEKES